MLRCIGIDDEQLNNDHLKECCEKIEFIKLIGTFTEPFATLPLLDSGHVDLVFLDFNLDGITATEFIKMIPAVVHVVIVSAETESTIRSSITEIDRFITIVHKPYDYKRLEEVCKKAANTKL